jgi:hypothetical protein
MKRYLISSVAVLTILVVALIALSQPQGDFRERMARMREAQSKALEVLQQQVAELKKGMEQQTAFDPNRFRAMSDEEREKSREELRKGFEARQTAINTIIAQVAILQGQPQPAEGERYILINTADLKAVQELATKEKATETTERIKALLEPPRRGFGGRRGGQPSERPRPQQGGAEG